MPVGMNSTMNVRIHPSWDGAELTRLTLRDGTTFAQVIGDINQALALVNTELTTGYLAGAMSLTSDVGVEYPDGTTNGVSDETEFTQPDAHRADITGHMLPLRGVDRKLQWTQRFFEEARQVHLDADIASLVRDFRQAWDQRRLARHFKSAEETGRSVGLGASGVSVPLLNGSVKAIGGAASDVPFIPMPMPDRGGTFASSHSHFLRMSGITQANLETAVKHLWEHGHDGPYELIVSLTDIADWSNTTNVTGYKERADPQIQYGSAANLANVADLYLGAITTKYGACRLVASGRIPTKYWTVFKTYGPLDRRNPLRVRFDEIFGFGIRLVTSNVSLYPLAGAVGRMRFGVGIGEDRTNGVCVYNHTSGDYVDPTIS